MGQRFLLLIWKHLLRWRVVLGETGALQISMLTSPSRHSRGSLGGDLNLRDWRLCCGTSLVVQWLRFWDPTAEGTSVIPWQGTQVLQASQRRWKSPATDTKNTKNQTSQKNCLKPLMRIHWFIEFRGSLPDLDHWSASPRELEFRKKRTWMSVWTRRLWTIWAVDES